MGLATAFDQAQYAPNNQATNGLASGSRGESNTGAEPGQRKADAELAYEAAVPEKMGVDGTVGHGKVQLGREQVFKIFPDLCGVDGFVFHDCNPEREVGSSDKVGVFDRQLTANGGRKDRGLTQRSQKKKHKGPKKKQKPCQNPG